MQPVPGDHLVSAGDNQSIGSRRGFFLLFIAFFACAGCLWFVALQPAWTNHIRFLASVFIILAAVLTVASLARRLPVENAIMAAVYVVIISFVVQIAGLK